MRKTKRESLSGRRTSKLEQAIPDSREADVAASRGARPSRRRGDRSRPGLDLGEVVHRALARAQEGATADIGILNELGRHGFSRDEILALVGRRGAFAGKPSHLSPAQSDRAVRLARITAMAERVFADDSKAHGWLREPSLMLQGSTPLNLLKSETGAHLVEQALHRIDYGMLA